MSRTAFARRWAHLDRIGRRADAKMHVLVAGPPLEHEARAMKGLGIDGARQTSD